MLYEECLRSTFLEPQSWGIVTIGLILAFGLNKIGWKYSAALMAILTMVVGLIWAWGYHEFNCVELYQ